MILSSNDMNINFIFGAFSIILLVGAITLLEFKGPFLSTEQLDEIGDGSGSIQGPNSKIQPNPEIPLCRMSDVSQLMLRKIPASSGEEIVKIKRLHDNQYRYFAVTLKNSAVSMENVWLFDIGLDGIFSSDDSAKLIITVPSTRISDYAVLVSESIRDTQNGREELFWMETVPTGLIYVKSCELPNCSQIDTIVTLPSGTNYNSVVIGDFGVFAKGYDVYLVFANVQTRQQEIRGCSLVDNLSNSCSNSADRYTLYHTTPNIDSIHEVKNEGMAFADWSGKKFLNVNTGRVVALPNGARVETAEWSGTIGVSNYALMLQEDWVNGTQLNLVTLDTVSGSTAFIDTVDEGPRANFASSPFDPRVGGYPVIVFDKGWTGGYATYKKDSLTGVPRKILDNSAYWNDIELIVTKDRKAYSFDRSWKKLYSYDCG